MVGRNTGKKGRGGRTGTKSRGQLFTRNLDTSNLTKEYEAFLGTLEDQIQRITEREEEELHALDVQEEEFFLRSCNLYTAEQLDMSAAVLEKYLELENKNKLLRVIDISAGGDYDAEVPGDEPDENVFRMPIHTKKPAAKKKRRSSVIKSYNSAASTPVWHVNRGPKMPKFMTSGTGIKNVKPRLARVGEIAFSDNGSPIVVGNTTRKALPKGRMALVDLDAADV